ncbi:MAG: preprotein translocase subunit SecA [bacterium]|nr:preprotein translocase subunit SecA [bacterium]
MTNLFSKIFGGDPTRHFYKEQQSVLDAINQSEPEFQSLSDISLREKSLELKKQLQNSKDTDEFLVSAFALIREASRRVLKQRHFDVQLLGGIALHQGKISEMKTGEGKTLAATAPAYLNALAGRGVHIVTVNDYLAKRDAVWMGQIYYALGLSVGCIAHDAAYIYDPNYQPEESKETETDKDKERDTLGAFKVVYAYLRPVSRKEAYNADITYGTNNEFGFDYLRDNLVYDLGERSQRGHYFAIVDEVDSILIDEARTPLIITVPEMESSDHYRLFSKIVPQLIREVDYNVDEKLRAVTLTEEGIHKVEDVLKLGNLYDPEGFRYLHYLEESLKAWVLFKRDKDYVVKDGEVLIVDEFTGRLLYGRRYSGGLHQAIEAKEGVKVQNENRILASITFQNYFRLYEKLSGMTGTALTSSEEFDKVYGLDVVSIPTNKPMIRQNLADLVYKTEEIKWKAIIEDIKKRHELGQPILVGTISIEKNEKLAALLNREGINYSILNAKNHEQEGAVIAQAGRLAAVTVATNMAGRGVDIILGGNPSIPEEAEKVKQLGGLHVVGTERHDARRIDNQLRGRSGRQGDPGSSQFFVSLEDDLMRIFGGEKLKNMMTSLNYPEEMPIQSRLISRSIESAQSKVEGFHFDARKHTLEYDDVLNKHRSLFYHRRDEVLELSKTNGLEDLGWKTIERVLGQIMTLGDEEIKKIFVRLGIIDEKYDLGKLPPADHFNFFSEQLLDKYQKIKSDISEESFIFSLRMLMLKIFDALWTEHLENMEYLRESVMIRAYGQHDPLVEYKSSGHQLFKDFFNRFDSIFFDTVFTIQKPVMAMSAQPGQKIANVKKIGRNDPCPCGSGKKYKRCHGK